MIVIGLTGKAGSGKGVVADYLVREHGFTKLSFAAPLKKMLSTLDPIISRDNWTANPSREMRLSDLSHLSELEIKAQFPEYRRLLQVLGTDCIRSVDEDLWVRAAMAQLTDEDGRYVFDDCRFPNEAHAIQVFPEDNVLIHVERPGVAPVKAHESEFWAGNMEEDVTLLNTGTIADLETDVENVLWDWFGI